MTFEDNPSQNKNGQEKNSPDKNGKYKISTEKVGRFVQQLKDSLLSGFGENGFPTKTVLGALIALSLVISGFGMWWSVAPDPFDVRAQAETQSARKSQPVVKGTKIGRAHV